MAASPPGLALTIHILRLFVIVSVKSLFSVPCFQVKAKEGASILQTINLEETKGTSLSCSL